MLLATGAYLIVITYHALPLTMFQFIRISNNPTTTYIQLVLLVIHRADITDFEISRTDKALVILQHLQSLRKV